MMLNLNKKHNVEVKDKIPETDIHSSAEQQLLYNLSIQSELGNIVSFYAKQDNDMIVLKAEYDSLKTTYPVEVGIKDKELFFRFFRPL